MTMKELLACIEELCLSHVESDLNELIHKIHPLIQDQMNNHPISFYMTLRKYCGRNGDLCNLLCSYISSKLTRCLLGSGLHLEFLDVFCCLYQNWDFRVVCDRDARCQIGLVFLAFTLPSCPSWIYYNIDWEAIQEPSLLKVICSCVESSGNPVLASCATFCQEVGSRLASKDLLIQQTIRMLGEDSEIILVQRYTFLLNVLREDCFVPLIDIELTPFRFTQRTTMIRSFEYRFPF